MKTRHFLMMATLAVGMAMTSMMMISCSKEDNPVEELDGEPGAGAGGGSLVEGDWTYSISDNDVILTGYIGLGKTKMTWLGIPLTVYGKYVTYIATPYGVDFSEFKKLQTLYFDPDCRIDEMPSVRGCSRLENIYFGEVANKLPNSMKTVKSYTFEGTAIMSIDFNQVNSVGDKVFIDCKSLHNVNIPNAAVSLGEEAFACIPSNCTVTLKDSLNKLTWHSVSYSPQILVKCCDGAMGWCGDGGNSPQDFLYWTHKNDTLTIACPQQVIDNYPSDKRVIKTHRWLDYTTETKTLVLSDVYAIGAESFKGLRKLQSVTLNDGLMSLGDDAFRYCESLETITLPASVTNIGYHAFMGCTGLKSFTIPEGVLEICNDTFSGCTSLETITIPASVTNIRNSAFNTCTSLTSVTIPEGVTDIGEGAFCNCTSLTSVTISDGVKNISDYAFLYCTSLTSVTIPASVRRIGLYAFYGCTSLKEVFLSGKTGIDEYAFPDGVKIIYI